MHYTSRRVRFPGRTGHELAGIVDSPREMAVRFRAVFAHCFTCSKDLKAIARISRHLTSLGIETLRFDFTGLGDSGGDFSGTTFLTNLDDTREAINWMAINHGRPELLIGHSLGGAAMLTVAQEFDSTKAVVNIASPSSTRHLAKFLASANPAIRESGYGGVTIGGREHRISREMITVLEQTEHDQTIRRFTLPLMVMFSETDETLPYSHAIEMFETAGGPTSFINLDGSDHLLVERPEDIPWVGNLIAAWAGRYCGLDPE